MRYVVVTDITMIMMKAYTSDDRVLLDMNIILNNVHFEDSGLLG